MKKVLSLLAVAAVLALSWSCKKDEPIDNSGNENDPGTETPTDKPEAGTVAEFTATLDGSLTKTAWAEGDAVIVYAVTESGDIAAKYILAEGAGTATGKFVPSAAALTTAATGYFASYPYNEDMTFAQHNTFAFVLEADQAAASPLFAYAEKAEIMTFKSSVGAVKLPLKGTGNVARIELSDKESRNVLNGNVTYNPKTGNFQVKNSAASKNQVTVVLPEKVELGATVVDFVIEVPAKTLATGATVVLYDVNDSPISSLDFAALTVEAGKVTAVETQEIVPVAQTVNLNSKQGYANTYQVPAVGVYKFEAVKGNDSSAKLAAATAEITWETWCNADAVTPNSLVKSVTVEDGYVVFETADTYHEGNALVSVKDAAGTIIWSWTLWFVETLGTIEMDGYVLLDRNLGALTTDPTKPGLNYGLLWQWGRSTPILGLNGAGEGVQMTNAQGVEIARVKLADLQSEENAVPELAGLDGFPVEYVIANPTNFFYSGNRQWAPNALDETAQYLWNPAAKTIYDPCPAGYQVITPDVAGVLFSGIKENVENDSVNKGFSLNGVYYPYAGWWKYSGDSFRGETAEAYFWTSGTRLRDEESGYNVSTHYQVVSGVGKSSYESKGDALTIRCEAVAN